MASGVKVIGFLACRWLTSMQRSIVALRSTFTNVGGIDGLKRKATAIVGRWKRRTMCVTMLPERDLCE